MARLPQVDTRAAAVNYHRGDRQLNTAIIVAAGSGTRFGSNIPKQFIDLAGKPVIIHTLEKFQTCEDVNEIVLVLSEDGRQWFQTAFAERSMPKLTKLVAGGVTRSRSVKNGLEAVDPECEIVAVHDGARPLVCVDEISRTIQKARETGAACLVVEVTDTIKEVDQGRIRNTVDRSRLRRAVTPQAFRTDLLIQAFSDPIARDAATDECYLVEKLGVPISCVEGSARNIKITHDDDIRIAEALMRKASDLLDG